MTTSGPERIAFFVSSHGFGHASRSCAVMQALREKQPALGLRVYTETPEWFFRDAVGDVDYRQLRTDVGLVQRSPLKEDIPATLKKLAQFMPFSPAAVDALAEEIADQDLVGISQTRRTAVLHRALRYSNRPMNAALRMIQPMG